VPAPVTVQATKHWWPLTAVVAWILAPDARAVADLCQPLPGVNKAAIHLRLSKRSGKAPKAARRELFDALASAKLTAHGDLGNRSGLQPIPAVEWSGPPERPYGDGTDRIGPYRGVVIARDEVLRCWPEPAARRNVVTGDQKAITKSRARELVRAHLAKAAQAGKPRPSRRQTEEEFKGQGMPRRYLRAAYSEICEEQDQGAPTAPKN
jgi:hypothetical protein